VRLSVLLDDARACRECVGKLPNDPRPLLQAAPSSRIVVIGQAPGAAAHDTGVPWDDRSGRRLRDWLGVSGDQFYDPKRIALVPMGFCYPGKGPSGDLAPRPECAPLWHPPLLRALRKVELTVLIGRYALDRYLPDDHDTMTNAVRAHADLLPDRIALPHPSPRNNIWLKKNPWFERQTLPALRRRVAEVLAGG